MLLLDLKIFRLMLLKTWPIPRNLHEFTLIGQGNSRLAPQPAMAETTKARVPAMGRWKKDRRLNEVKAILRRLQHIANEPNSVDLANANGAGAHLLSGPTRLTIVATVATVVAGLGLLTPYALVSFRQPTDPVENQAPQGSTAPSDVVAARSDAALASPAQA